MRESTLVKVSIITALAGLAFLLLYAGKAELHPALPLDSREIEEKVLMKGSVTQLRSQDKVLFLQLEGERTDTVDIIAFPEEELFLQQGDYIEVAGTVEEYNGKREIIASKIVKR
jgi:DNA/RNA endonuclease YhcR with UshA esterase domain